MAKTPRESASEAANGAGQAEQRSACGTQSGDDAKPRTEQGNRSREEQVRSGTATAMAWLARERKDTTRRGSAAQGVERGKKRGGLFGSGSPPRGRAKKQNKLD